MKADVYTRYGPPDVVQITDVGKPIDNNFIAQEGVKRRLPKCQRNRTRRSPMNLPNED